jgi:hypothetical protein
VRGVAILREALVADVDVRIDLGLIEPVFADTTDANELTAGGEIGDQLGGDRIPQGEIVAGGDGAQGASCSSEDQV